MKNKIICLVLSLVFIIGMFACGGTYAWFFTYGDAAGGILHNFRSNNIGYTVIGSFVFGDEKYNSSKGFIEPEMELLKPIDTEVIADPGEYRMYVLNTSTISTQLRVKVTYTYFDENGNITDLVYDASETSPFVADTAEGWVYSDGYLYYGAEGENAVVAPVTEGEESYIPLFRSLKYSGPNSDFRADWYNPEGGEYTTFSVNVTFEAKQEEFVTWEILGSVGFEVTPAGAVQAG